MTAFLSWQRLTGSSGSSADWGAKAQAYEQVETYLKEHNAVNGQIIMVNNPPGYYAVTGRQAVVIPHAGMEALLGAAGKYQSIYLVIDENFPEGLADLYRDPGDVPGLIHMGSVSDMQIYLISP